MITVSAKVANEAVTMLGGTLRHLTWSYCPSLPLPRKLRHAAHQAVELWRDGLLGIVATFEAVVAERALVVEAESVARIEAH